MMSNLIKKQKQSLIIMIVTMIMIISALPVFSLATEVSDTKTPEITINVESGRVKGGKKGEGQWEAGAQTPLYRSSQI